MDKLFNTQEIGKIISNYRKKNGMTQMELADKLLISYQAVSNWERGITMPDIAKLPELAKIFNISIDELIDSQKGAELLEAVINDEHPQNLTADELLEVAPLLKPNQVDNLAESVNNDFSSKQAEQIIPLMSFEGNYEFSNEEMAEKFYTKDSISFFSVLVHVLSDEKKYDFALRSYEEDKIAFFSVIKNDLTSVQKNYFRNRACEENKINFFAVLSH